MDLYNSFVEIEKRNVRELLLKIQYILKSDIGENNYFTMEFLSNILKEKNIEFTEKELHDALYILLVNFGSIVRYDNWNSESIFQVLDERHEDSSWQKSFYNLFDDDTSEEKNFLLIADTHIGNKNIHNFKLINNIYEFAIKTGIKNIFHLGDVFDGIKPNDSDKDKQTKLEEQLELFEKYYPNLDPDEVRTISLLGNHDKTIYGTYATDALVDFNNIIPQLYDLRNITKDNPGFLFYARKMFSFDLNKVPMHFSHRLYINALHRAAKVQDLEDIINDTKELPCDFSICFSGHLHKGLLCVGRDGFNNDQLFVGVPSTSSINRESAVAYIITTNKDNLYKYVHITAVYSTIDDRVYTGEVYSHKVGENNPTLKKIFK